MNTAYDWRRVRVSVWWTRRNAKKKKGGKEVVGSTAEQRIGEENGSVEEVWMKSGSGGKSDGENVGFAVLQ
jgi:hypothetical protein